MVEARTALAAVLGIGLGIVMIAAPAAIIQVHTVGRLPHDRGGEYGADGSVPNWWLWIVRLLGVGVSALGGYFAAQALSLL